MRPLDRADRVLAVYDGRLSAEELAALGVTPDDAAAALSLVRLDLEVSRVPVRRVVDVFLRDLGLSDG